MKIRDLEMLCTKIEIKKNKEGNQYLMISLLDLGSGDVFEIVEKEQLEIISKVIPMNKYNVNLDLTSSKYGLSLKLNNIDGPIGKF